MPTNYEKVQPGKAVLLVLVGAVADLAQAMDEDGPREAVARFAFVELLAGLTRRRLPGPGTRVIAAAMIGAAVRHRRLDLRAHSAEAIG